MNTEKIRQLNDTLRKTFIGGQVMLTTGILEPNQKKSKLKYCKKFAPLMNLQKQMIHMVSMTLEDLRITVKISCLK